MMRSNLLARSLAVLMGITAVALVALFCEASNDPVQDEAPRGMVSIPGGKVLLGTTKEEIEKLAARISSSTDKALLVAEYPQHEVTVDPFYIGETEVTNRQWKAFLDATGSQAVPYYFYLPKEDVAPAPAKQPQQAAKKDDPKKDDPKKDDPKKDDPKKDDPKKDDPKKDDPKKD
ncbi:MAG: SUMF1/EgtB/PvdO family nonheme iron enzyme, partial [Planctomycetota bacterium]